MFKNSSFKSNTLLIFYSSILGLFIIELYLTFFFKPLSIEDIHKKLNKNEKLELDEEVKKYMQGDNSEVNKKNFFSQKCEDMIIDDIENSAELYKKISGDEPVKNFIFKLLFENYQKTLNKVN